MRKQSILSIVQGDWAAYATKSVHSHKDPLLKTSAVQPALMSQHYAIADLEG